MKVYKIITDKQPTNCIECPLISRKICGKEVKIQGSSSGAKIEIQPDNRCVVRVGHA
ncbi:MAG: hypothetical protein K0S76_446 [Herbinix sp.]|jgi:hypothetical protein|nr:hypothetical protein [Herbinix sp.]